MVNVTLPAGYNITDKKRVMGYDQKTVNKLIKFVKTIKFENKTQNQSAYTFIFYVDLSLKIENSLGPLWI